MSDSIFDFNGSSNSYWNYSNKNNDNFSTVLQGTVVEVALVPKTKFGSNEIEYFENGNIKRNLRFTILTPQGEEINWVFNPGSPTKPTAARKAIFDSMIANGLNSAVESLLGKAVTIATADGVYNNANPRPWAFRIDGEGNKEAVRGSRNLIAEMQQQPQRQQPQPQPQVAMPPQQQQQAPQQLIDSMNRARAATQAQQAYEMGYAGNQPQQQVAMPPVQHDEYQGLYDQDIPF